MLSTIYRFKIFQIKSNNSVVKSKNNAQYLTFKFNFNLQLVIIFRNKLQFKIKFNIKKSYIYMLP